MIPGPTRPAPIQEGKPQLDELTSARFLAALAVLLGHFGAFLHLPPWLTWMVGGHGVSFFFVLSGFILCYRYWDAFADGVRWPAYRTYFVARIARVYPSYVLALVLITIVYLAMNAVHPAAIVFPENAATSWLVNLLALQTFAPTYVTQQVWNGPGWSISTEFCFYLACPAILYALARCQPGTRGLAILLVLTVMYGVAMQAGVLYLVFERGWNHELWLDAIASRNIFWRIPEFLAGVLAARFLYAGHIASLRRTASRNIVLALSLALFALISLAPWPQDPVHGLALRQVRLNVGYLLPFTGMILALAAGPTFLSPLLRRPSFIFLGEVSYGIYIYHWIAWMIVAHGVAAGFPVPPPLVALVVVGTIGFAAAIHAWFERPARGLIRSKLAHPAGQFR